MSRPILSADTLKEKLNANLDLSHIDVQDTSDGCGYKFHVIAAGEAFKGKSLLQQHRIINETLSEEMKQIHALSLKTMTPEKYEEWKKTN